MEKLKNLNDYANYLIDKVEKGTDILAGQIPPLIKEILTYNCIKSLILSVIFLTIFSFGIWLINLGNKLHKADDDEEAILGCYIMGIFITIISGCLLYQNIDTAIKIWIAPKLYVLEYLKGFIK